MNISYDSAKNTRNIELRGLSFERVADFEFETALFSPDVRRDYGEVRIRALGRLKGRLHALVFTETVDGIRVISFRKANKREERIYETQLT
ncbi:MAG: BrnT family toxin [Gallionella sp.]|nr:BrnT family toxin [Gallionella sp.]